MAPCLWLEEVISGKGLHQQGAEAVKATIPGILNRNYVWTSKGKLALLCMLSSAIKSCRTLIMGLKRGPSSPPEREARACAIKHVRDGTSIASFFFLYFHLGIHDLCVFPIKQVTCWYIQVRSCKHKSGVTTFLLFILFFDPFDVLLFLPFNWSITNTQIGETAQWLRALLVHAWGLKFRAPVPMQKACMSYTPVIPALGGRVYNCWGLVAIHWCQIMDRFKF